MTSLNIDLSSSLAEGYFIDPLVEEIPELVFTWSEDEDCLGFVNTRGTIYSEPGKLLLGSCELWRILVCNTTIEA